MRKLLAILLLTVFGLSSVAPAFASENDASGLHACCRRAGAHHCAMTAAEREALSHGNGFSAVMAKCPYCPASVSAVSHVDVMGDPVAAAEFVARERYFAGVAQTESLRRISRDRSRQKRGPPAIV